MAVQYIAKDNSYTCNSTDDLTDLVSNLNTEGIRLIELDTGIVKIFNKTIKNFVVDNTRYNFRKINSISKGNISVTSTALIVDLNGYIKDITINVRSGNVWFNVNGMAVANSSTSLVLSSGESIDVKTNSLSVISDSSGAMIQVIVWD